MSTDIGITDNTVFTKNGQELRKLPKINVRVKNCFRPEVYGRPIQEKHVNTLAAIFDFKKVGEICVYKVVDADGNVSYEIVDGNHRVLAMLRRFGEEFMFEASILPEAMTVEDRAEEYKVRNDNVAPLKPVELFKADHVMKHEETVDIVNICNELNVGIVNFDTTTKYYPNVVSVRDLRDMYRAGTLKTVLNTIRLAYDGADSKYRKKAMTSQVLRALNTFWKMYGENPKLKVSRLIEALKGQDSTVLVSKLYEASAYTSEGVSVLVELYNNKLQKNRLSKAPLKD